MSYAYRSNVYHDGFNNIVKRDFGEMRKENIMCKYTKPKHVSRRNVSIDSIVNKEEKIITKSLFIPTHGPNNFF